MRLDHPTSRWVEEYIHDNPGCTVMQIAAAWYPPEVISDRTGWLQARGIISQRIQLLRHWDVVIRVDQEHKRGEPAQYRHTGVIA